MATAPVTKLSSLQAVLRLGTGSGGSGTPQEISIGDFDFKDGPTWEDITETGSYSMIDGKGYTNDWATNNSLSGSFKLKLDPGNNAYLVPTLRPGRVNNSDLTFLTNFMNPTTPAFVVYMPVWAFRDYDYNKGAGNALQSETYNYKNLGPYFLGPLAALPAWKAAYVPPFANRPVPSSPTPTPTT